MIVHSSQEQQVAAWAPVLPAGCLLYVFLVKISDEELLPLHVVC
jgi:hypothetical protein